MDKLKKIPYLKIIITFWVIFSVIYIGIGIVNDYLLLVYSRGYENAVVEIMKRPEIKECKPLLLHNGKEQVNLIDIVCLQPAGSGSTKK